MKFNFVFFITFLIICIPVAVQAADFVGMVGIPGLSDAEVSTRGGGLNKYINTLYRLSISIAALLAVIKIVMAGAKYMLSDIVTHKEDAKKDIQGALIGLLIVIGAIVILNTVNSDLTKVDLDIKPAEIKQGEMTLDEAIRRATETSKTEQEKLCNAENNTCIRQSCDYFNTDTNTLLYIPYISEIGDTLVNKSGCKIWCDWMEGTIIDASITNAGTCLYPSDPEQAQERLIDGVIGRAQQCAGKDCKAITCPFLKTELICAGWCDNINGINVDLGMFEASQCVVKTQKFICNDMGTGDDGTSFGHNCDQAKNSCDEVGGISNISNGGSAIECNGTKK